MITVIKQLLLYVPAPTFFTLGTVSWITAHSSICTATSWFIPEMALMWFIMALAHCLPYIVRWESRKYGYGRVYTQPDLPSKQQ